MQEILDRHFPKGKCKERGQALVMLAYIEMALKGIKFNEDGEPIYDFDINNRLKKDLGLKGGCYNKDYFGK